MYEYDEEMSISYQNIEVDDWRIYNTYHVLTLTDRTIILNTANNLSLTGMATKYSQYQTTIST